VGFDRAATLRQAEKLLTQGKLDAAIAAYASVVEQQPTDWNTANTLGDLYVRVGQADRAADQFTRSAERLIAEGFLARPAPFTRRLLKLKPDDERVLLQAGELAAQQGLYGDARAYLAAAADRRTARGDTGGAADIRIRADTLDPNDYERRQAAARLRAERGDIAGAVRDLREIAQALGHKGRPADALAALEHAAQLVPDDDQVRTQLVHAAVEAGDFARARASATTVEELRTLADALDKHGRPDDAIETLRLVARLSPGNVDLALRLARTFLARGDVTAAAEFLSPEVARADPPLLLSAAELQLRTGRVDAGLLSVRRFLDEEPDGCEPVALLSCRLAADAPEGGFRALAIATDAADARSQVGLVGGGPAGVLAARANLRTRPVAIGGVVHRRRSRVRALRRTVAADRCLPRRRRRRRGPNAGRGSGRSRALGIWRTSIGCGVRWPSWTSATPTA
jgi:tetratricopeptide (TPR) repeat protein